MAEGDGSQLFRWTFIIVGIFGTVAIFISIICIFYFYYADDYVVRSMAPNEIGDTIAGFSGALAFLWLVLGYFQQGLELRETRKEVRMQREALTRNANQAEVDGFIKTLSLRTDILNDIVVRIALKCGDDKVSREKVANYNTTLEELSFDYLINNTDLAKIFQLRKNMRPEILNYVIEKVKEYVEVYENMVSSAGKLSDDGRLLEAIEQSKYGKIRRMLKNMFSENPAFAQWFS